MSHSARSVRMCGRPHGGLDIYCRDNVGMIRHDEEFTDRALTAIELWFTFK